jgi:hypothetical protein
MVGNVYPWDLEPVVRPGMRDTKRQRLIRVTKQQIGMRAGPVRQVFDRDQIVWPFALELGCRRLLQRSQRAIVTIITSSVYVADLRDTVTESVLHQHEIAVALREITELMLDLASGYAGGTAGPLTTAVLRSQKRAVLIARDANSARVMALESLAAQVAAAEAARRDWETAHRIAANNDRYLGAPSLVVGLTYRF